MYTKHQLRKVKARGRKASRALAKQLKLEKRLRSIDSTLYPFNQRSVIVTELERERAIVDHLINVHGDREAVEWYYGDNPGITRTLRKRNLTTELFRVIKSA